MNERGVEAVVVVVLSQERCKVRLTTTSLVSATPEEGHVPGKRDSWVDREQSKQPKHMLPGLEEVGKFAKMETDVQLAGPR